MFDSSSQGHRLEQKPCRHPDPCPGESLSSFQSSKYVDGDALDFTHLMGSSYWTPLFSEKSSLSPCACGCIYIVGKERRIRVTSGSNCSIAATPLRWKVKVSFKEKNFVEYMCDANFPDAKFARKPAVIFVFVCALC